jgi:hypothetical protein
MTTTETRNPMEEGAAGGMNNVRMTDVAVSTFRQDTMATHASPQPSPRINLPPPPNPPFTFPSRPSSSAPSSLSRSTGRRHQSAIEIPPRNIGLETEPAEPRRQSAALPTFSFNPGGTLSPESANRRPRPPALPDFSFNPGATSSTDAGLLSPSQTPTSPRTVPSHIGHRRGGSEFVGGKLTSGESITVMSTSPTKSESGFASPTLAPSSGPRRHQRGHSHRRSGAISSHDLTLILQSPNPSSRGSSAPASPSEFRENHARLNHENQKMVETSAIDPTATANGEEVVTEKASQSTEPSPKLNTRARVGFSDTLEFIPRPLSLVSTDTTSTVRPGHSLSGSISSIASITNSANTERDSHSILGSAIPRLKSGSRPSTAGAVLERSSSLHHTATEETPSLRRRNSIPVLSDQAQSGSSNAPAMATPTKTPKRWSFFGFDSFANTGSPTKTRPASASSSDTAMRDCPDITLPGDHDDNTPNSEIGGEGLPVTEKKKSSKKRQKRVKNWAGSILTRKSKTRAQKSKARRRSQTPPISRPAKEDDIEDEPVELVAQEDQPFTIRFNPSPSRSASDLQLVKSRPARTEDETPYPMIDLDAALGPFNTPTRDPQWDEAQRSSATQKRQLHSAAGMRGFSGPGMHYHRRAESAPEMPPFEGGRFSIHRFGSSSTMADVFEEDEEDEEEGSHTGESGTEDSTSESQGTSTGDEEENDVDDTTSTPTQEHNAELASPKIDASIGSSTKRKQSDSSLDLPPPGIVRNEASSSSLHNEVIMEEDSSPFPARRDVTFAPSSETSGFSGPSQGREGERKEYTPPDATSIILPGLPTMPISPYPISHSSSFPSPRSPVSYDAHRISTAPSSIADENNFRSLLMGEPGPEVVRLSVDVPSLTSTNSTMTRESSFIPGVRPRNMPFHDQRPASFTSTAFGRRRSSLASLSRLISSAHGERSKLSMEVPFENEVEKKTKPSKSKRLTRMMQFWKSSKASSGS